MSDTSFACNLPIEALDARVDSEINPLFDQVTNIEELADGYEFFFDSDAKWIARLTQFIHNERACCGFFLFELVVRPKPEPISLKLRGENGVKAFLEQAGINIRPKVQQ